MIPDEIVEQVSQQADIVAIIGEHVRLKKVGSVWRGPCPFHQGTNANFSVKPGGGYTCFVCGEKGSVFTFVQKRLGMTFVEAVKYVGEKTGIEVPEIERKREGPDPREPAWELQATAADYFRKSLWDSPSGAVAREYLAGRDVSRALADRFGLGFAPKEVGAMRSYLNGLGYDDARLLAAGMLVKREEQEEPRPRFRDRLMFPITDVGGHTVGFGGRLLGPGEPKYLNSAESEVFSKGRLLYNLGNARNAIRKEDRVILVEGYFDALRLVSAGIECVVAPMGTALTDGQADLLAKYTRHIFLLYDGDAPGQKATFRAADLLLAKGLEVRVVTLPEGEDPDTFARKHGKDPVEKALEQALDVFDRKVQLLERAGWFADLQHKRRALDRLLPTIRAASDPVTRDLYVARAAQAAGVAREVLLSELHNVKRGTGTRGVRPAGGRDSRDASSRDVGSRGPSSRGAHGDDAPDRSDTRDSGPPPQNQSPYRSMVPQGNAEQTLLRVMLTQPVFHDQVIEELGKITDDESPVGGDGSDLMEDEMTGPFRDPVHADIYEALLELGPDASPEAMAERLDPQAIHLYEELRGDKEAVVDARKSIADAVRQLRGRSVDARIDALKSLLSLAGESEKDGITVAIKKLTDEKRSLGVPHWGSVRRR
jgi:DNA primase